MNKENLNKLKNCTQDTSLLYVEDSVVLQKQLSSFLGNMFDRLYQAYDGESGLEVFKTEEPDIIITDIDMPHKDGINLIEDMRRINPEVNVIVLSAHHDQETLLKTINLGIANFLPKPLNTDKLVEILLDDIDMISKMQKIKCTKDLTIIQNHNVTIDFFNTYKGIPIQDSGKVIDISDEKITFKVTLKQLAIIKEQGFTLVKIPEIKKHIKAKLDSYDVEKNQVSVINPRYINFKTRSLANKRIKVDKSFKLSLDINEERFETYPYDASYAALGLVLDKGKFELDKNDAIMANIEFVIEVKNSSGVIVTKNLHKITTKCDLLRLQTSSTKTVLALKVNFNEKDNKYYERYLQNLEKEVIFDLQNIIKKLNSKDK